MVFVVLRVEQKGNSLQSESANKVCKAFNAGRSLSLKASVQDGCMQAALVQLQ